MEYCSFTANVCGIKFYSGLQELHPMMHVRLIREPSNHVDSNAVIVKTRNGRTLGHVERKLLLFLLHSWIGWLNLLSNGDVVLQ